MPRNEKYIKARQAASTQARGHRNHETISPAGHFLSLQQVTCIIASQGSQLWHLGKMEILQHEAVTQAAHNLKWGLLLTV